MIKNSELIRAGHFDADRDVALHVHAHPEMVYIKKGCCKIEIPELGWNDTGLQGDVFFLPQKKFHNQINLKPTETIYFAIDTEWSQFNKPNLLKCNSNSEAKKNLASSVLIIYSLYTIKKEPKILNQFLHALLILLEDQIKPSLTYSKQVQTVLDYIQMNYLKEIKNATLARVGNLSESHLMFLFKKETGFSPIQYQIKLKLSMAKSLLSDPYLRINEIANKCGFEDLNYFNRLFKKHEKITPGNWRKKTLTK